MPKGPEEAIVEDALAEVQTAAKNDSLRKLLQSHLIRHCTIEKLQAFHRSNDKYKKYMVSYLAQTMAIDMFESFGRALASELDKTP
ncbi:hypothetical protein BO85DRAFT_138105 [Aspergillus piperis CBS 112811]|uniref:Uncharacterized protein n=1 Tax=Aspergillus piperis CBS 112811 TaxID=1448313 RepID=A0A8G1RFT7_9EURO|nr:hypothetical protein BO85DRAFT_137944 [Aspergillus piperis CBS 112811]XP_025520449.1 hypothetical protein BO85DRAFT_138105 [Aspergillus piperis CBS 112811]RAH62515.1 hypothetical protein BO85DRAFT_137944 [Aspergillus piperis CBS 112811]RAH62527.1 hypothetical protein BO85DRAFT_138105 [Aspergillus piperis CBS 112811]